MFQGSMVALVTPMREGGDIDEDSLQGLIDFHVENHSDALVSVGTTGESATLNEAEHCHVLRRTVEMAAGRIPIIAGTGANSTREAIDLTRCAHEAGADPLLMRLSLMKHELGREVLESVAEMSGWGSELPEGHARGLGAASFAVRETPVISWVYRPPPPGRRRSAGHRPFRVGSNPASFPSETPR